MSAFRRFVLGVVVLGGLGTSAAQAGHGSFAIGVNIGAPGYYYRPYPAYVYPYPVYRPYYPVYVAPPPVVVAPAPVIQPAPVVTPSYSLPEPTPVPQAAPAQTASVPPLTPAGQTVAAAPVDVKYHLQMLAAADERVRADSVLQLGKARATRAVDPLAATLAGDRSPMVREAAARSLGLIGSPQALPALQRAAQADADRDVRRSAQFAVEVIQSRN